MKKKVLVVVDYQNDFVDPKMALPVPKADTLYQKIQNKINSPEYSGVIYTFDTHTPVEYNGSGEQKLFPNIHCEFKKDGWNLFKIQPKSSEVFNKVVDALENPFDMLNLDNEYFFTKNLFDVWAGNPVYGVWFEKKFPASQFEVDVVGVATNYCVFMNVMGMVPKGYKINVIAGAVAGIEAFPDGTVDVSFEQNVATMKNSGVSFI